MALMNNQPLFSISFFFFKLHSIYFSVKYVQNILSTIVINFKLSEFPRFTQLKYKKY